jgi:glycosyltransferase involved in cell wall biosynthesis
MADLDISFYNKLMDNKAYRENPNDIEHYQQFLLEHGDSWDVIWTHNYTPASVSFLEVMKDKIGSRIVVDIDDWFEEVPAGNIAHRSWGESRRQWYRDLISVADEITCSTAFLQDHYKGVLAPNFIDPDEWKGPRHRRTEDYVLITCPAGIGRAGDYFRAQLMLEKALERDDVRVLFIGFMPEWALTYPNKKVIYSRFAPLDLYPQLLNYVTPDIVISPMEHNDFNRAKSNLKWLEASAVGACFLGERFGEYERTIEDMETGVLADSPEEWMEKLDFLISEKSARQRIARQGREEALDKWTWNAVGDNWRDGVCGKTQSLSEDAPEAELP